MTSVCECLGTYSILSEGAEGFIIASRCSCVEETFDPPHSEQDFHNSNTFDRTDWTEDYENEFDSYLVKREKDYKEYEKKKNKNILYTEAKIPNLYSNALKETFYKKEILESVTDICNATEKIKKPLYFFYGKTGSGKTQSAIFLLMNFLKSTNENTAFYITSNTLIELKRCTSAYSFEAKALKDGAEFSYQKMFKKLERVDFLILDELGQEKLSEAESKVVFALINSRYSSRKVTILISNHCDNKDISLGGKLLSSLVGERISSRIKSAKSIYFSGPDYRAQSQNEDNIVTKEEADNFNMGEASPKLMTLDDNTHHIMTWLTRNPAFETISTQRRKELTYLNEKGEEEDKDREGVSIHENVWIQGAVLKVYGPVCDQEDMKLYAVLVKQLTQNHKDGNNGLILKISASSVLELLGLQDGGENISRLKRQLNRLVRMSLNFKASKGKSWMGPLLTEVLIKDEGRNSHLIISFSPFMIAFYRAHEYTTLNKDIFLTLSGDSATLFAFFTSHDGKIPKQQMTLDQFKKLLAIPETTTRKAVVRRIKNAHTKLLATGIFNTEKSKFENDILYTVRNSTASKA